jgi:hypothetical protein
MGHSSGQGTHVEPVLNPARQQNQKKGEAPWTNGCWWRPAMLYTLKWRLRNTLKWRLRNTLKWRLRNTLKWRITMDDWLLVAIYAEIEATKAEIEGMKALNQYRRDAGRAIAYSDEAFFKIAEELRKISKEILTKKEKEQ